MGQTGPSKTTLLRYTTGKVKRRNLMVERYIQEAINKLKMKLGEEQLAESEVRFRELVNMPGTSSTAIGSNPGQALSTSVR